jgi:hypothetical protein
MCPTRIEVSCGSARGVQDHTARPGRGILRLDSQDRPSAQSQRTKSGSRWAEASRGSSISVRLPRPFLPQSVHLVAEGQLLRRSGTCGSRGWVCSSIHDRCASAVEPRRVCAGHPASSPTPTCPQRRPARTPTLASAARLPHALPRRPRGRIRDRRRSARAELRSRDGVPRRCASTGG